MWRIPMMFLLLPTGVWFLLNYGKDLGVMKYGLVCSMLGLLSNSLAIFMNGWRMPVIGVIEVEPGTVWKAVSDPRVPWLVDRFDSCLGIFSAGDVLILSGVVLTATFLIVKWVRG